jgi:hypothetical protein
MNRKTKIKNGFYPILLSQIKRLSDNCERWGYGNSDTSKFVAEVVIDMLSIKYPEIPIRENLYDDLVQIAHDYNSGKITEEIQVLIPIKEVEEF